MWRDFKTSEGLLLYNRDSGLNILLDSFKYQTLDKPLYAQVKVTNKCNVHCRFCSQRSASTFEHEWTSEELFSLFKYLDHWKLQGIAIGGGEPFTFPGLAQLVKKTWNETRLDISITSNGYLISDEDLRTLAGNVGEVRISCWSKQDVNKVRRLVGKNVPIGINTILFRNGTENVKKIVCAAQNIGIDDFLILQCRPEGRASQELCPSERDFQELSDFIRDLGFHVKVDVETGKILGERGLLHRLGLHSTTNPIICITENKCVARDSFSREKIPIEEFGDIQREFEMWRSLGYYDKKNDLGFIKGICGCNDSLSAQTK